MPTESRWQAEMAEFEARYRVEKDRVYTLEVSRQEWELRHQQEVDDLRDQLTTERRRHEQQMRDALDKLRAEHA